MASSQQECPHNCRPQAADANKELLELLVDYLPRRYPDRFSLVGNRFVNHAMGQEWDLADPGLDPLEVASLNVQVSCRGPALAAPAYCPVRSTSACAGLRPCSSPTEPHWLTQLPAGAHPLPAAYAAHETTCLR